MLLEIAVFNYSSAIKASKAGADRLELCDNYGEGGTTSSFGVLKTVKEQLEIPVFPIIRPRGGDFYYNEAEFDIMKADVSICKQLGFEGIVFGILTQDRQIDIKRCNQIMELAYPMKVTFHRAFDRCRDAFQGLEDIIELGCDRILTSGQTPAAADNLPLICELIKKANNRIIIMPGSGVRSNNLKQIIEETNATEFHSSAMLTPDQNKSINSEALKEEPNCMVNEEEIKNMKLILNTKNKK